MILIVLAILVAVLLICFGCWIADDHELAGALALTAGGILGVVTILARVRSRLFQGHRPG